MTTATLPTTRKSHGPAVVLAIRHEAACGDIVIRALESSGPATPKELALAIGAPEALVRGVLQALASVHCLDYDRSTGRYSLWCEWPRRRA